MYVKQVVLFGLLYLSSCCCIRVWRHKSSCDRHGTGFLCLPKTGDKKTIIFECPFKNRDYHIYINEFSGPKTLETLIIKNCKSLTVLLRCTKYAWERKNLKYLLISNIEKLKIQNVALYQSLLPPTVVFENIKSIENIPSHTFTQTNKKLNLIRCVLPNYNFTSIHFRNVSINRVQAKAFYMPNGFGNVTFTNVKIRTLDTSSIVINQEGSGVFKVEHSILAVVKASAIQVVAGKTEFSNNKFAEISLGGIKVKSDVFNFVNNSVEGQLHNKGLDVAAQNTVVSSNRFNHLKTGAFSGVSGSIKGHYEYVGNVIDFLEDDSLLPKLSTYKNASTQVKFQRNTFSCECYKSGWLLAKIGRKGNSPASDTFYRKIFDKQSGNVCSSNCSLSFSEAQAKIVHGKCSNSVTVSGLCAANKIKARKVTSKPNKFSTFQPSAINKLNKKTTPFPITKEVKTFKTTKKELPALTLLTTPKVTTSPVVNSASTSKAVKLETFNVTNKSTNETTTINPTKTYISNTTNKPLNEKESIAKMTETLLTTQVAAATANYTTQIQYSTSGSTSEGPNTSETYQTFSTSSSPSSTIYSSEYTEETQTQTEEDIYKSTSSLETSVVSLQQTTGNSMSTEDEVTTDANSTPLNTSLLTSNLTTATISVTTLPTTKQKFTYTTTNHHQQIKTTTTSKRISTSTQEMSTNSSVKQMVASCSNVYYLSSSIFFLILSVVLISL